MTKTFKIGEYATGGIIEVKIGHYNTKISALDWNTKHTVSSLDFINKDIYEMEDFLYKLTSCYHADKILDYIRKELKIYETEIKCQEK